MFLDVTNFWDSQLGNNIIQVAAFALAIATFSWTSYQQLQEQKQKDLRSSLKLKIFEFCATESKALDVIVGHLAHPDTDRTVDKLETRKAVYEMLAEQTLRLRNDGTYKARRNVAKTDDESGESLKLSVLQFCEDKGRTYQEIYDEFASPEDPTAEVKKPFHLKKAEVSKAIYEMLSRETLRLRTDHTLRARRNIARDSE